MLSTRTKFGIGAVALALLTLQPLTVQAQQDGALPEMSAIEQAWKREDFVFVRAGLQQLAEQTDNPLAHYRFGRVLLEGRGGPVDVPGAVVWLQRAVDANHRQAATLLARVYLSQMPGGPERNEPKAAELFNMSATRGDAEAQYYLGLLYLKGVGVEKQPQQAFNWMLAAAEQQYLEAQYELARMYSKGIGTGENPQETLRWLTRAADDGHAGAQFFLALAMDSGKGAPQNRDAALGWYRRSAEAGHMPAQRVLGQKYLSGDGVKADVSEATRWLKAASNAGDLVSIYLMGTVYRGDYDLPANPEQAWELFSLASENNFAMATTALAGMLESGQTGAPDLEQAVKLYRTAVSQGDPQAELILGRLAGEGKLEGRAAPHRVIPWALAAADAGDEKALDWLVAQADGGLRAAQSAYGQWLVEQGESEGAVKYLRQAAEAGDINAQYQLAMMLTTGDGIGQDYVWAHAWMNIAAAGGHQEAAQKRSVLNDLMTPEQVAEAQAQARAFFKAARQDGPVTNATDQGR